MWFPCFDIVHSKEYLLEMLQDFQAQCLVIDRRLCNCISEDLGGGGRGRTLETFRQDQIEELELISHGLTFKAEDEVISKIKPNSEIVRIVGGITNETHKGQKVRFSQHS